MTPEEARARAQAEAEAEFEFAGSSLSTIPTNAPSFAEGLGSELTFGKILESPVKAAEGILGAGANYLTGLAQDPMTQQRGVLQTVARDIGQSVMGADYSAQGIADKARTVGQTAAGVIPGGMTAFNYAADVGSPREQTPEQYGKMLGQELQLPIAGAATVGASRLLKGVGEGVTDVIRGGAPEQYRLQQQALNDEIYANKLDFASRTTAAERSILQEAGDSSATFTRENPLAGIDKSAPGRVQINQLDSNLNRIETEAVLKRNAILPEAVKAEQSVIDAARASGMETSYGIKLDDIPTTKQTAKGAFGIENLRVKYGDAAVQKADEFVKQQFGVVPEGYGYTGSPTTLAPSKALTLEEANTVRQKIDSQIRELGGFDDSYWQNQGISPSVADGYIETLRLYRQGLDDVVKNKIGELLGPQVAEEFTKAGQNISMSKTYRPMVERFKLSTGEGFIPGSAKKMPPEGGFLSGKGLVGQAASDLLPGRAIAGRETKALQREANAISQLEQLLEFKRAGAPQPLPRSWSQIKADFTSAQKFGELALSLGLINSIEDLANINGEVGKQMAGIIASQYPSEFQPTPDNVNVIDGELQNPMEVDLLKKQALDKPAVERAGIMSGLFNRKYTPMSKPVAPMSTPTPVPSMQELSSAIPQPQVAETDYSYNKGASDQVSELERITAIQDFDGLVQ